MYNANSILCLEYRNELQKQEKNFIISSRELIKVLLAEHGYCMDNSNVLL